MINQSYKSSPAGSKPEAAPAPSLPASARELAQAEQTATSRRHDPEPGYNKQEQPARPGFWSRVFGKKQ